MADKLGPENAYRVSVGVVVGAILTALVTATTPLGPGLSMAVVSAITIALFVWFEVEHVISEATA